jgi:hypothetical protein
MRKPYPRLAAPANSAGIAAGKREEHYRDVM